MRHLLLVVLLVLIYSTAQATREYLYQWDSGSGTTMPGWTYSTDVAYGNPGWTLDADGAWGGGQVYSWSNDNLAPRNFNLNGYDSNNLGTIVTDDRSPSTTTGGALKVYEHPDTLDTATHLSTWWLWYDGEPMVEKSITAHNTDRMSFYLKTTGTTSNTSSDSGSPFHIGTYLMGQTACSAYGSGDGTPYEGPGNQHYYHYLYLTPGAWLHVELDRHPTHKRGAHVAGDDPAYIDPADDECDPVVSHPMHYFEHLGQFYMEIRNEQAQETSYTVDEMSFYSTSDATESAEEDQNDISITSVWVGYWPATGKWQIGWQDMSYADASGNNTGDFTNSTFEIRWSTSAITNANYSSATQVAPEWYSSPEKTSYTNGVRRRDAWSTLAYTQFELPDGVESGNDKIYFAIKDVSQADGSTAGTQYPWNRTDGHDAPSSNIHTIDYALTTGTTTITCYPDVDEDLYPGTGSESVTTCTTNWYESSHFTSMASDCDDMDEDVNPGLGNCGSVIGGNSSFRNIGTGNSQIRFR